jgi:hypothetical protein
MENTARFAFCGKDMVLDALAAGTLKTLGMEAFKPIRAEIGRIMSAASTDSLALRNVAVRVVL